MAKSLYLSEDHFAKWISVLVVVSVPSAPSEGRWGGGVYEVLPSKQNIFLIPV